MKVLQIEVVNYKTIKVFTKELDGDNMVVAGETGAGKTTSISILWDIIKKVGDPLKHGELNGKIRIVLGDENIKVFAERKFTSKTNEVIILTSEGERISVEAFKAWFSDLSVDPHKIMELGPNERTKLLLSSVRLPNDIDIDELDKKRNELAEKRLSVRQRVNILKGRIDKQPEEVGHVLLGELLDQLKKANEHNSKIYEAETKLESFQIKKKEIEEEIENLNKMLHGINNKIERANKWLAENQELDTSELEKKIDDAELINQKANTYERWLENKTEFDKESEKLKSLEGQVRKIDEEKRTALENADWPIDDLAIKDGQIYYKDCLLENCGKSEQQLVCTALAAASIARDESAKIKSVRVDGIESMGKSDFEKLQAIFEKYGIQYFASKVTDSPDENEIEIVNGIYED